jgi:hypothetical protein
MLTLLDARRTHHRMGKKRAARGGGGGGDSAPSTPTRGSIAARTLAHNAHTPSRAFTRCAESKNDPQEEQEPGAEQQQPEPQQAPPSPLGPMSSPARSCLTLEEEIDDAERRKELDRLAEERRKREAEERVKRQLEKASSSSWGGWGSMWSSVASTVTSTVSSLSENLADKVLDMIDDVEEKLSAPASAGDQPAVAASAPAQQQDHQEQGAHDPLAGPESPRRREPTLSELLKEAKEVKAPAAAREDARSSSDGEQEGGGGEDLLTNVMHALERDTKGLQEIGHSLVETSAGVLESLGRTALSFLADERVASRLASTSADDDAPAPAPGPRDASAPPSPRRADAGPPTFAALFEDNMGRSHLEALQLLARGQEKAVVSRLPGAPAARRAKLDTDLAFIKDQLAVDDDVEREDLDAGARAQLFATHMKQVAELAVSQPVSVQAVVDARARCQLCVESWLRGEPLDEPADLAADPAQSPVLAEVAHRQALRALAAYASHYVEALRRAAEFLLLDVASGAAASAEDVKRKASFLRTATLAVGDDLVGFANEAAGAIRRLAQSESRDKAHGIVTNIFLEVGNADATLQDAMQLLAPILQSLLLPA